MDRAVYIAVIVAIVVIIVCIALSCIKIVPQAHAFVIERLGAYQATWSTGLHFKVPFIEQSRQESEPEGTGGGFSASAGYYEG